MKTNFNASDLELLSLWRKVPARDLLRSDLALVVGAMQRSAHVDPFLGKALKDFDPRRTVRGAAAAYGFSLIQRAYDKPGTPETALLLDVGASFHVIAARDGYATSGLVLAQLLADGAFSVLTGCRVYAETRHALDPLVRSWVILLLRDRCFGEVSKLCRADDLNDVVRLCYTHYSPDWGGVTVIDRDRPAPTAEAEGPKDTKPKRPDRECDGTTVRVIAIKPGDRHTGGNKDSERLRQQYFALFQPLALGGIGVNGRALVTALRLEFPWLAEAIDAVADQLSLNALSGRPGFHLRPLLLVGPPGAGKTRFARRLAHLAGTAVAEITGAGSSDNRMLQGTASGWSGAQPAFPLVVMARHRMANPVIVVDEIDKTSATRHNGRMTDTLLAMLERETSRVWFDEALLETADLSHVSWVLTANDVSDLPRPLLSRLTVVETGTPRVEHFERLIEGIRADLAAELDIPTGGLPDLLPEATAALRKAFRGGTDIRTLKRAVTRALAQGGERRVLQ